MKRLLFITCLILVLASFAISQPTVRQSAESNVDNIPLLDVNEVYVNDAVDYALIGKVPMIDIGYAHVKSYSSTGSFNTFTKEDFAHTGYTNLKRFLIGKVPGLSVTQTGMNSYSMQIRGPSSFLLSTEPLLVVDGMPMQSTDLLSFMHPNEVKSITILKGPEAAIYGVRGANGVIIVKTY